MTVAELKAALEAALERGLPPETTVVIDAVGQDGFMIANWTVDPTTPGSDFDMWFTIQMGEEADSRFTPGGLPDDVRERLAGDGVYRG